MRTTFRPVVDGGPAYQRQLRDEVAEPAPPIGLELKGAIVRPVSKEVARRVILRYEWLGTMPASRRYYGLFFGPYLAGVTVFGVGNGTGGEEVPKTYRLKPLEIATLRRGAMVSWAPSGANSKLVAWSTRLLRRDEPGVKLVLAYVDSEAGEIGTIYQAAGWRYLGLGVPIKEWVAPNGVVRNNATVMLWRGKLTTTEYGARLKAAGWRLQASNPKGRYALVVDQADRALMARVGSMTLPYPKRPVIPLAGHPAAISGAEGESDDAPDDQSGEDASRRSPRSTVGRREI